MASGKSWPHGLIWKRAGRHIEIIAELQLGHTVPHTHASIVANAGALINN